MRARHYTPKGSTTPVLKPLKTIPAGQSWQELLAVGATNGVPEPKWPFGDEPEAYAEELQDTLDAMQMAQGGAMPVDFMRKYAKQCPVDIDWDFENLPEPLERAYKSAMLDPTDPMSLPRLVTMDVPYQLVAEVWHWCVEKAGGIGKLRLKNPTVPGHTEFLEYACGYWSRSNQLIYTRMKQAAEVKNFYCVARPEEVMNMVIAPLRMPPGVFTFAPDGCPPHDSYVAGHGTFDGAVGAAHEAEIKNSPNDIRELRACVYMHAMGRSLLGVHTPQDNVHGLALGYGVYNDEPNITAADFYAARAMAVDGDVDLDALIAQKRLQTQS